MTWILIGLGVLFIGYAWLIAQYHHWWNRPERTHRMAIETYPFISVLIPARNEEARIGACLQSLIAQQYPADRYEILVIDDHSTDRTSEIVRSMQTNRAIRLLHLADFLKGSTNSYKKKALELGVNQATGTWILTTDADCIASPYWLETLAKAIRPETICLVAPVNMRGGASILSIFQQLDFLILQAITGATVRAQWHAMNNGANFGFRKDAFEAVEGYQGIDEIASGDDMLLMQKLVDQYPNGYVYLKNQNAMVETVVEPDWKSFIRQRIRWASKAGRYSNRGIQAILLGVYVLNVLLLCLLLVALVQPDYWGIFLLALLLKTGIEWPFVASATNFFGKNSLQFWLWILQPLHITYIVSTAMLGWVSSYQWKDRTVR
jgi:cellulose synthase/poly-beta-1,6-N-acetylglucosamine synthase-like glycosyltransferase